MNRRTMFAIILLGIAAISGESLAQVPTSFSYQGRLTDSAGKPAADGSYDLIFRIYSVASGPNAPLWTSPTTPVNVSGGIFSTVLTPTASVFNTGTLWLETTVGTTVLSPRTQILATPFAVRSSIADTANYASTVANGSITLAKLASDVVFARAPYQSGVISGLPTSYTLAFEIEGVPLNPQATLSAPYKEEIEVIWYYDAENRIMRASPGRHKSGNLVIRRRVTGNRSLYDWAIAVFNGQLVRRTIVMFLKSENTTLASWSFPGAWPCNYSIKMTDDGLPVEEVTLVPDGPVTRVVKMEPTGKPSGSDTQLGYNSGYIYDNYMVSASRLTYPNYLQIASSHGFGTEVVEYLDAGVIRKRPGNATHQSIRLRQNPSSPSSLYTWYLNTIPPSTVVRDSISVTLSGKSGELRVITYENAWPCSYILKLADDGQPVEEFDFVYELPSPTP